MTNTRDKLNEALFCLNLMKEVMNGTYAATEQGRNEFRYALNLFLSSARSITWIMKYEFDKVPSFESWYGDKEAQMRRDEAMRFLLNQRNISLKQRPVQPYGNTNITAIEYLTISEALVITAHDADGTQVKFEFPSESPAPLKPTEVTMKQAWYFDDLPEGNNDVFVVCEEHITKLAQLVTECEQKFDAS